MPSIARRITQFSQKEIDYLFKHARSLLKNKYFTILYVPRTEEIARILIVISKKVGNAPERNKIRRQIKAIFYQEKLFELPHDYIVIAYKNATRLSFDELKQLLLSVDHVTHK